MPKPDQVPDPVERLDPEATIENALSELDKLGQEWRNDWSDFDGRYALMAITEQTKRIRSALPPSEERLREAVEALDFSDNWTFDNAEPGELVSMTRPIEMWKALRSALHPSEER